MLTLLVVILSVMNSGLGAQSANVSGDWEMTRQPDFGMRHRLRAAAIGIRYVDLRILPAGRDEQQMLSIGSEPGRVVAAITRNEHRRRGAAVGWNRPDVCVSPSRSEIRRGSRVDHSLRIRRQLWVRHANSRDQVVDRHRLARLSQWTSDEGSERGKDKNRKKARHSFFECRAFRGTLDAAAWPGERLPLRRYVYNTYMTRKIVKTGSSLAVTLPHDVVETFKLKAGDEVDVSVHPQTGAIVIRPGIVYFEGGKVTKRFKDLAEDLMIGTASFGP